MRPEHIIIAVSALGGIIGGMGMGGGTLLIPLLTLAAGLDQRIAQSINIIAFIPMSLAALAVHNKNGYADIKRGAPLAAVALIGAVAGSFCVRFATGNIMRRLFGGFLIALGVIMLVKLIKDKLEARGKKRTALFKNG